MTPLNPNEARDRLAAADTLTTASDKAGRSGALTTAGVGVLVAACLVIITLFAEASPITLALGMTVYAVALSALMSWHSRTVQVAKRGWNRGHFGSFLFTVALFVIGLVWFTVASPSWSVFGPYCVLVAMPMLLVAGRMARR